MMNVLQASSLFLQASSQFFYKIKDFLSFPHTLLLILISRPIENKNPRPKIINETSCTAESSEKIKLLL